MSKKIFVKLQRNSIFEFLLWEAKAGEIMINRLQQKRNAIKWFSNKSNVEEIWIDLETISVYPDFFLIFSSFFPDFFFKKLTICWDNLMMVTIIKIMAINCFKKASNEYVCMRIVRAFNNKLFGDIKVKREEYPRQKQQLYNNRPTNRPNVLNVENWNSHGWMCEKMKVWRHPRCTMRWNSSTRKSESI